MKKRVRRGVVDYAKLHRSGRAVLRAYLRRLESVCLEDFATWTKAQKLAFWINAYNAYTIELVLDHYPLESIRTIGWLPGSAFRKSFIPMQKLRGDELSLNDIEHDILRKELFDARIHFAIVCASKSCPILQSEAYRASDLEAQLTRAARGFLRDESKNRYDEKSRTLHLSAIFDWFEEDFERSAKNLPTYLARYADPRVASELRAGNVVIQHLDYDWSLNGR